MRGSRLVNPLLRACLPSLWIPFERGLHNQSQSLLPYQPAMSCLRLQPCIQISAGTSVFRRLVASSAGIDKDTEVDEINRMFAECRDEIEMCREDAGTVYFNESAEGARELVKETLGRWEVLLKSLPAPERDTLVRSMGLKMEQLKAELAELDHLHDDD